MLTLKVSRLFATMARHFGRHSGFNLGNQPAAHPLQFKFRLATGGLEAAQFAETTWWQGSIQTLVPQFAGFPAHAARARRSPARAKRPPTGKTTVKIPRHAEIYKPDQHRGRDSVASRFEIQPECRRHFAARAPRVPQTAQRRDRQPQGVAGVRLEWAAVIPPGKGANGPAQGLAPCNRRPQRTEDSL
jgi:hypothetical protein